MPTPKEQEQTEARSGDELLFDPLDSEEVTDVAEDALNLYTLPAVRRLLRGEWDVLEAYEAFGYVAVRASTWMVNPKSRREDYIVDFAKRPRHALRDFACWPMTAEEPWLRDIRVLDFAEDTSMPAALDENGHLAEAFVPDENASYFLHIDLALRRDAAGLALSHWDTERSLCVIDLATRFEAPEVANLDFKRIRALVYAIQDRGFSIRESTLDRWNSADTIAEFNARSLRARAIGNTEQMAAYDALLELLVFRMLRFTPNPSLRKELIQLQWTKTGRLDHPQAGSKDIADAVAMVASQARTYGSNLVAFGASRVRMNREHAVTGSSERRDAWLQTRAGEDRHMGVG